MERDMANVVKTVRVGVRVICSLYYSTNAENTRVSTDYQCFMSTSRQCKLVHTEHLLLLNLQVLTSDYCTLARQQP